MQHEVEQFLNTLINEVADVGIDLQDLRIDHIAYSTSSTSEYETLLPTFLKDGELIKEAIISNRRVAIIKLKKPLQYNAQDISVVELIEPISGQKEMSGWEHAEFLVNDYQTLLDTYPNLNWNTAHMNREHFSRVKLTLPSGLEVKFLDTPVLQSVAEEQ